MFILLTAGIFINTLRRERELPHGRLAASATPARGRRCAAILRGHPSPAGNTRTAQGTSAAFMPLVLKLVESSSDFLI